MKLHSRQASTNDKLRLGSKQYIKFLFYKFHPVLCCFGKCYETLFYQKLSLMKFCIIHKLCLDTRTMFGRRKTMVSGKGNRKSQVARLKWVQSYMYMYMYMYHRANKTLHTTPSRLLNFSNFAFALFIFRCLNALMCFVKLR